MAHLELCRVCKGSGKYKDKTCHGCNGKGQVEVRDEYPYPFPPSDPVYPWYPKIRWWGQPGKKIYIAPPTYMELIDI